MKYRTNATVPEAHNHLSKTMFLTMLTMAALVTVGMALSMEGCSGTEWTFVPRAQNVRDHNTLVNALRAKGYQVTPIGTVSETSAPVAGHVLQVNEWSIHTYEFEKGDEAELYSRTVETRARDAETENRFPSLHKFQNGNFIVLYEGPESSLKEALQQLLSHSKRHDRMFSAHEEFHHAV